jgi:hypothetical protein
MNIPSKSPVRPLSAEDLRHIGGGQNDPERQRVALRFRAPLPGLTGHSRRYRSYPGIIHGGQDMAVKDTTGHPQTPPRELTEAELQQTGGGSVSIRRFSNVTLKRGVM